MEDQNCMRYPLLRLLIRRLIDTVHIFGSKFYRSMSGLFIQEEKAKGDTTPLRLPWYLEEKAPPWYS